MSKPAKISIVEDDTVSVGYLLKPFREKELQATIESASDKQHLTFSRKEQRIFIILIILGLSLTVYFGLSTVRSYIRLQRMGLKPGTTDIEAIRGCG